MDYDVGGSLRYKSAIKESRFRVENCFIIVFVLAESKNSPILDRHSRTNV